MMTGLAAIDVDLSARIAAYDWQMIALRLDQQGWSVLPNLLADEECDAIADLYSSREGFRSHVVMARHGFGSGEYRYFSYPLPKRIMDLRNGLYPYLAPIANGWNGRMGLPTRFSHDHAMFLDRCHAAGQTRPTPLLLRYGPGDYNCLHQDLYGEQVFPLQVAVLLSAPQRDFTGGEFVLTEQRPRMQSRVSVVPLSKGDAVLFAVHSRPHAGTRGDYRVTMRHGVSAIGEGARHALGIIFHDAS